MARLFGQTRRDAGFCRGGDGGWPTGRRATCCDRHGREETATFPSQLGLTAPMGTDRDEIRLDFRAGGNAAPYCAAGWSTPEPDETWTIGAESVLVLPAPSRPASYVMELKFRPLVALGTLPAQRLRVVVNDVQIAEFTVGSPCRRACLIPWAAVTLHGETSLRIAFHLPDAARPSDLGLGGDSRMLGLAFTSVRLSPAREPAFPSLEPPPADPALAARAQALPLHDLMLQFESLGQNCEFGLVQRQCGAEPLGLLRFSSTPLPFLLDALEARFEGMGRKETITARLSSNGREYMVEDGRFGFLYHAWVAAGEMTADEVALREARRVPFLVRKLLEDLETAEKIFVFKGMAAMPEEEVFPLAMAIRRYGPNTLLFVTLADAEHAGGTVEEHLPGFLIGYVDRFAPADQASDLELDQWVQVCREAYRLQLAAGRAAVSADA